MQILRVHTSKITYQINKNTGKVSARRDYAFPLREWVHPKREAIIYKD